MSPGQFAYVDAYVRDLANRMGLPHFRITVTRKPADPENNAQIAVERDKYEAEVFLAADFESRTSDAQRCIVVHEMLHVHTIVMGNAVISLEKPIGSLAWPVFHSVYDNAEERMVDALAEVFAPFMPPFDLPPA